MGELAGLSNNDLYKAAALAEGYESVPVSIDVFLNDPYYLGQTYGDGGVYPYWMDALHKIYPNPIYSPYEEVCLSGDTEVDLLDGSKKTMAQICAEGPDKVFWVLGFNVNTKAWEPCRAGAARMTGVKPVYKVTLDNGQSFKATGNHKVLGKDNRWHRVDSLKVGQSLMPYNLDVGEDGYAYVWNHATQEKVKRCRAVQQWKSAIPEKYHVHHKNQDKLDDRPSNLISLSCGAHLRLHNRLLQRAWADPVKRSELAAKLSVSHKAYAASHPEEMSRRGKLSVAHRPPETWQKLRAGQLVWVTSPEGRAMSRQKLQQYNAAHPEVLQERSRIAIETRWADPAQHVAASVKQRVRNLDPEFQRKAKEAWRAKPELREAASERQKVRNADPEHQAKAHRNKILKGLNRMGPVLDTIWPNWFAKARRLSLARNFDCLTTEGLIDENKLAATWPSIVEQAKNFNHRIVSIEELPPEPVYNFTVDRLHSFPLSCGVISHNCVTGCIGAGKTSFAIMGALYDLYHVVLLKNPHKKYKLLPTTHIIFSLVTATMDLAAAVMANQLLDTMGASPFFCERFSPKKGERLDEDMFPHHIGVGYGSRGGHNLGKAVIGAIIDEANFQDKVANQAVENYNTITRRMKSRFMGKSGSLPCRRWIVSSRTDSAAFLESHIEACRGNPDVIIFEPAIWDVQKVKGIYCGKTFPVFTGNAAEQPRILTTDEEVASYAGYTIDVPVEYMSEFENDLPKSLQDIAGVATRNSVNLIYNVEKLNEALCLENCMITDEPQLTLTGEDQLIDYYKRELPKGQYFVHLDAAKSGDRFGFAMSRVTEPIQIKKRSAIDGVEHTMLSPSVETPLAFGIKALPGSQIPFFKVRQFLCDLRSRGVNIGYVSCDGFQSVDMLQLLAKLGFKSGYESADRTKDPYLKLAENVLLGLHKMPKSGILKNELLNLQNLPKKVDHPLTIVVDGKQVKGGKDIADACCVSAFTAITASMTLSQSSMIQQMQSAPRSMSMKERQDYVLKNYFGFGG